MATLFWISLFGCCYSYFFYPVVLRLLIPKRRPSISAPPDHTQASASLIITCHNEQGRITEKIENSLAIDYPHLEIIVASDASSDQTDAIVEQYADRGVRLVRAEERLGKENAQLHAIRAARGDILIFSDTATQIPKEAIAKMMAYYNDPKVGAVSSEDRFVTQDGSIAGEGAYVKYEMWLRRLESDRAGLVGLSGSFFSARKSVCEQWDIHAPSDFNTALNCAQQGYVAVTSPDVLGFYTDIKNPAKEYQRKLRTIIRGLTAIERHPEVLNLYRFGYFSVQTWSHKILRWAVPWFMLTLLLSSLAVADKGSFYRLILLGQIAFYGIALASWKRPKLQENTICKLVFFFTQVNLALATATLQFFGGKRMSVWTPSER